MASQYTAVFKFVEEYGKDGVSDQKALEAYFECETDQVANILRSQLFAIKSGNYEERIMDRRVGMSRKAQHGSYEQWAKNMLQWMAKYSKA